MRLRRKPFLIAVIFVAVFGATALATGVSASEISYASTEVIVPAGWEFIRKPAKAAISSHTHEIGTLRQTDRPAGKVSDFFTTPVILRRVNGLSQQTARKQFLRLEAEVRSVVQKGERTEPLLKSDRKIIGQHARIENEYGKKQGDRIWVYASTYGDFVLITWTVSRSAKLTDTMAQTLRENFFEMARALKTSDEF